MVVGGDGAGRRERGREGEKERRREGEMRSPVRIRHLFTGSLPVARGRELKRQEGGVGAELQGSRSSL